MILIMQGHKPAVVPGVMPRYASDGAAQCRRRAHRTLVKFAKKNQNLFNFLFSNQKRFALQLTQKRY